MQRHLAWPSLGWWVASFSPAFYRQFGTLYVVSSLFVGVAGLYMAIYSFGGWACRWAGPCS